MFVFNGMIRVREQAGDVHQSMLGLTEWQTVVLSAALRTCHILYRLRDTTGSATFIAPFIGCLAKGSFTSCTFLNSFDNIKGSPYL
jgi:hypothetical protein